LPILKCWASDRFLIDLMDNFPGGCPLAGPPGKPKAHKRSV
jgi:hypothetical protein